MKNKVIIFGIGRGADISERYFRLDSDIEVAGFTVDDDYYNEDSFKGKPVVKFSELVSKFPPSEYLMFAPLGFEQMNKFRASIYNKGKELGYDFANYIASNIFTPEPLNIGENCLILEGNTINFDVKIGNNVVMWSGNQVGDESIIGDNVWMSSHVCISGAVTIENNCLLANKSVFSNNVVVGEGSFIGSGSIITKPVDANSVILAPSLGEKVKMAPDMFLKFMNR